MYWTGNWGWLKENYPQSTWQARALIPLAREQYSEYFGENGVGPVIFQSDLENLARLVGEPLVVTSPTPPVSQPAYEINEPSVDIALLFFATLVALVVRR